MKKELTEEEILKEMGWTIVCQSPHEIEHEDGSSASGSATQAVIDSIVEEYHLMKKEEAELAEEAKKAEATSSLNLEDINGMEILNFLNEQIDRGDELCDVSLETPLEFESQDLAEISDGEQMYELRFTSYFNNWGEYQPIPGNLIQITNDSVKAVVGEPFEGDGSEDDIEEVLREWLKTHKFQPKEILSGEFNGIVTMARNFLEDIDLSDTEAMDRVIEDLQKARTLMK